MSFETNINNELKAAMRSKDETALRTIRAIKSAILLAKTEKGASSDEITEEQGIKILQKLAKQRSESLELYRSNGREELAEKEEAELNIIKNFLPKQMDENEVRDAIEGIIAELNASSIKDMGKVMGAANAALAGKADPKSIGTIAKELLS